MTQAVPGNSPIPSTIPLASITAVRPRRPAPKLATDLENAFTAFKGLVADLELPTEPRYAATPDDIEAFADHLDETLRLALVHTRAVVSNLNQVAPLTRPGEVIPLFDETNGLEAAISEVVGALRKAASRVAEAAELAA
jgi:hypothetical protein